MDYQKKLKLLWEKVRKSGDPSNSSSNPFGPGSASFILAREKSVTPRSGSDGRHNSSENIGTGVSMRQELKMMRWLRPRLSHRPRNDRNGTWCPQRGFQVIWESTPSPCSIILQAERLAWSRSATSLPEGAMYSHEPMKIPDMEHRDDEASTHCDAFHYRDCFKLIARRS